MKIKTPYFTIQHLLREFAKGLGTKSLAGKEIDDACKHNEIAPQQLEKLKTELIHKPLTQYVNIYFADHIMEEVEKIFEYYLKIITTIPLDGVNAEKSQAIINQYFMSFSISSICMGCLEGMRTTPQAMALSGRTMLDYAFENLRRNNEWCEFEGKCTKEQKDRFRIWSLNEGSELPDITSIAALGKESQRGNSWGTFKARLITARFWDYFFHHNQSCDLDLIRSLQPAALNDSLQEQLVSLLRNETIKYKDTSYMGLNLFEKLRLRKPKTLQDKAYCEKSLPELKMQLDKLDQNDQATYYYYWMLARFNLHQGNLSDALENYKLTFDRVIYSQGENMKSIIQESLMLACRCPQPGKVFINKLRRMAVVFGIDASPTGSNKTESKKKQEDIESWEISAYAKDFTSFFTKESFFPDAVYPPLLQPNYGLWAVDESAHQLDLRSPNKTFKVGMEGGLIKKMPQIVYFSMMNNIEAVKKLIEAGADINRLSSSNESALLMAIQEMNVINLPLNSMSSTLFDLIAPLQHNEKSVNAVTLKKKLTPLGCAVQTGRLDIVKKVIKLGAKVDQRYDVIDETPLFTCLGLILHHTRPHVAELTAEDMKYSTLNLQSARAHSTGLLPHDLTQLKRVIAEQEKDPSFKYFAQIAKDAVQINIEEHTTVNDFREIALFLILQGASPNSKSNNKLQGYTPLMMAAELNEDVLFYAMAKAGGNLNDSCVNPQNNQRFSCFDIARHWRSDKILALYKQR